LRRAGFLDTAAGRRGFDLERDSIGGLVQPVADRFVPAEGPGFAREHQEGGLKDILGVVPVVQYTLADVQDHRAVPLDQRRESRFVALPGEPLQQFSIR
jgi:hypothetical protein